MVEKQLLVFISNEKLFLYVNDLVNSAKNAARKIEKNPYRNVIDPFSALIDAATRDITMEDWMKEEKARQTQKSFQNALGEFHQKVLGSIPDWENMGIGGNIDIKNEKKKIVAEIKNKYNTMNARSAISVYDNLAGFIDFNDRELTAYLVEIIPKTPLPYSKPFVPSERGVQRQERKNLLKIDGKSFYGIATGDIDALNKLYQVLPIVLGKILKLDPKKLAGTNEFTDLFSRVYLGK